MRKAAGIILIISGVLGLIGLVIFLTGNDEVLRYIHFILWHIISITLLVAGGAFCLRKRYWRECLASALLALFMGLSSTIDYLRYIAAIRAGLFYGGGMSLAWGFWILLLVGVISIIFICLKRKEWQEVSNPPDCRVSYGG
jgi:hypothetical protein